MLFLKIVPHTKLFSIPLHIMSLQGNGLTFQTIHNIWEHLPPPHSVSVFFVKIPLSSPLCLIPPQ